MPNIKVTDLPAVSSVSGDETVMLVQGGVSKKATLKQLQVGRDYGELYIIDGSTAQSIGNGATPIKVTLFNTAAGVNGLASGIVPDKAASQLVIARPGRYRVAYSISYRCGTNNVTWESYIYANAVRQPQTGAMSKIATGADTQCITGLGIMDIGAGQAIDLRMYHDNGGAVNLTIEHASISIEQLADA